MREPLVDLLVKRSCAPHITSIASLEWHDPMWTLSLSQDRRRLPILRKCAGG